MAEVELSRSEVKRVAAVVEAAVGRAGTRRAAARMLNIGTCHVGTFMRRPAPVMVRVSREVLVKIAAPHGASVDDMLAGRVEVPPIVEGQPKEILLPEDRERGYVEGGRCSKCGKTREPPPVGTATLCGVCHGKVSERTARRKQAAMACAATQGVEA